MSFKSSVLQHKDVIIFLYSCFFSLLTVLCDCIFQSSYGNPEYNLFVYFTIGHSLSYLYILCLEYPKVTNDTLDVINDIVAIFVMVKLFADFGCLVFYILPLFMVLAYMTECAYTYIICPGISYLCSINTM